MRFSNPAPLPKQTRQLVQEGYNSQIIKLVRFREAVPNHMTTPFPFSETSCDGDDGETSRQRW